MSEETKNSNDNVQFPLNLRLLEDSAKIREERKVIRARLAKIDQAKEKVSGSVHEKVRSDYIKQLDENTNQLLEKKQDIDKELATLHTAKEKVAGNVAEHKEKLEEINFRHGLGEFEEEAFNKAADEENEKLGKFKKILAAIESNISQYESIFEGEEDLGGESREATPPPPPPSSKKETKAPVNLEAGTDEYQVEKNAGYFEADTQDIPAEGIDGSEKTNKEIHAPETKKAAGTAKITIVEGDGKGKEYVITKDEFTMGRASSNFIVLKEAKVSRQHASVKRRGTEYLLEDLHSSNGVYVNDERIKEHALADGDLIRIGDFIMRFSS